MKIDLKSNPKFKKVIKNLIKRVHPDYNGRKIYAQIQKEPIDCNWNANWDGGTKTYYTFIKSNLDVMKTPDFAPWNRPENMSVVLPKGVVCVTHAFFQGHDCGCTVYFSKDEFLEQKLICC